MTRSKLINLIIKNNGYKKYLEIGVNTPAQPGWNFDNVQVEIKHGVDPNPDVDATFKMTSDEFFNKHIKIKYDLIFIDGLHIFEQACRDIINSLKWIEVGGTIVVHDCNPIAEITQRRERASDAWHGDVWKAILKLRMENSEVKIYTVDTDEGCAVIQRGVQKLFKVRDEKTDIYNYDFFNINRQNILNLISIEDFKKKINKKSMIIVKLQGGLCNQMFQYAVGRAIAEKNKTILKMDLSGYDNQTGMTPRKYELYLFNIQENFATSDDNKKIKGYEPNRLLKKILNKLRIKYDSCYYIKEKHFNFDPKTFELNDNIYLDGYWQTEKYFLDIADIIRSEFTLKTEYNNLNQELIAKINNCNSVSMHIRRNDYITSKSTNEYHGVCSLDYYKKAIGLVAKKFPNPIIFIFSDDLKWCEKNLKIKWPMIFVKGNKNYEDLIMMSKCHHNIIANSSFSWWGAWLNNNPEKMIIAPRRWFNDKNINTNDLIPETWIKI